MLSAATEAARVRRVGQSGKPRAPCDTTQFPVLSTSQFPQCQRRRTLPIHPRSSPAFEQAVSNAPTCGEIHLGPTIPSELGMLVIIMPSCSLDPETDEWLGSRDVGIAAAAHQERQVRELLAQDLPPRATRRISSRAPPGLGMDGNTHGTIHPRIQILRGCRCGDERGWGRAAAPCISVSRPYLRCTSVLRRSDRARYSVSILYKQDGLLLPALAVATLRQTASSAQLGK